MSPAPKNQVALVLGGTAPHIYLIEKLKQRGYRTVLVDYTANPPAKSHADEHSQISTLDPDAVLALAKDKRASLVISTCVDQANVTACSVGEKLGLPIPYDYETSLRVTNKIVMKQGLLNAGLKTARSLCLEDPAMLALDELQFPLMVKPADSCSSTAVKKAENKAQLEKYFRHAQLVSRTGCVIVEEFIEGRELSVYAFISEDECHLLMTVERYSVIDGDERVLKCYCTLGPVQLSAIVSRKIVENGRAIAREFGLKNTPLHLQVLVNEDDVHVIEFAPRVGGGLSYYTILKHTGFDIVDAGIDSFLGNKVKPKHFRSETVYSINLIYADPGVFGSVAGIDRLLADGVVEMFQGYKSPGTVITDDRASASRIGAYVIRATDNEAMIQKIESVASEIDVLDSTGISLYRRDLSLRCAGRPDRAFRF